MYLEKRKSGKNTKYYFVHSFRDQNNKVVKLRRFLGSNLTEKELEKLSKRAKQILEEQIEEMKTNVFDFSLSDKEIKSLNKYNDKIEINHFSEEQWQQFTEEFVYNTNAIEGSRVRPEEVSKILEKKETKSPDEIETKGVAKAIQFIRTTKQDLTINLILKLHKLCFEGSKSFAGKFRNIEVVIRGRDEQIIHTGTPVKELEKELNLFIKWYKKNKTKFKPLTLAAIIHNQFEDIHPFQDGNGRVGRLLLNFILLKNNYPPINILLEDRAEYYYILQEYQKNNKLRPTLQFLIKQYEKTLRQVTTKNKKD
ncbi:MAG: Fic family protein [Nanoarchaeota archaeon]|nr:Fic family protein [Nanoarchaeota archaeon]MBU1269535.1 Fic family protein [Nanoarchaeota archaeon]MBU1604419.1 Fic family protein [Nanoarchaeota archaeon]MBU2442431.1 Fic family protein [Nanoarchaeota archaeon]